MNIKRFILPAIIFACVLSGIIILSCDKESKTLIPIPMGSSGPEGPKKLYLYGTSTAHDGALGGRAGADALCAAETTRPSSVKTAHALLSVNNQDAIDDMPVNYSFPGDVPIVGPDGVTVIANNWPDLLDMSIQTSLADAGVLPLDEKGSTWWSGSDPYGESTADNCSEWSSNLAVFGEVGVAFTATIDFTWIDDGTGLCSASYYLVCAGY